MSKSEERLAMEAEAKELGETFPANIGDEKLAARIEAAKAARAETNTAGGTEAAEASQTAATPEAQEVPPAASGGTAIAPAGEVPAPTISVVCLREDGRRRAGRRWPEGESIVAEGDLTPFQLAQLKSDPLFRIES